jgi:hypothetical protein
MREGDWESWPVEGPGALRPQETSIITF